MDISYYIFDSLLIIFVCLFFDNSTSDSLDTIIQHAMTGDYPYFIPHLSIPSEAIHSLSLLFACGDTLGEVLSRALPSS